MLSDCKIITIFYHALCPLYNLYIRPSGHVIQIVMNRPQITWSRDDLCWAVSRSYSHRIEKHRYTYIIGHYNTSVEITTYLLTPLMLCELIVYMNDRTYRRLSWQFYLLTQFLPEICWEEVAGQIFSYFRFYVCPGVWTLGLRLISQHLTY